MSIKIRGPWAYVWGAWNLAWFVGLALALIRQDPTFSAWYFVALYLAFLPPEIIGYVDLQNDTGPEVAKQLSQWRQYVAQIGKLKSSNLLGWKLLAGGFGLLDGFLVGGSVAYLAAPAFGAFGITFGVTMGVIIAGWLIPHFGWREIFR